MNVAASRRSRLAASVEVLGPAGLLPLLILVGLAGVQNFDLVAFGVLSPDIKQAFHLSNVGIDSVASLTSAVPIAFAVWLGFLGDRHNRLRLSRWAGVLWGVTAILTGLAPVIAILILARTIGGVGLLSAETVYPSLLSDYYPPEGLGTAFFGYRFGAQGLSLLGAPLAGVIAAVAGWRPAFIVLAVPTFALVACLGFLREPPRGGSVAATPAAAAKGSVMDGFRRVRAIRTLRRTWPSAFLFGAGTVPFATILNNFFKDIYHVGDTGRGGITALLGIGGLAGIAIGGWLTHRAVTARAPQRLPVINGVLIVSFGALSLVLAAVANLAAGIALGTLLSIGAFGFLPAYTAMVALVTPPALRAQAYGWSLLFYALGAILITPIIGGIADAQGQRTSIAVLGAIVLVGGLVGASARRFVAGDVEGALRAEATVASDALLSCRGVDAAYGGVQVLFGVDFELAQGEMVAILGTNGAGKSTLLKTITGLLDPVGGAIAFKGRDITHSDAVATARLGIAQMPGGRGVFPTLTVADNLKVAGWLRRDDKAAQDLAVTEVLGYFPILEERWRTLAGSLSGGEQQMLSLAQAFIARPDLLLIDELSLGLAPTIVNQLVGIVRAIHASGTTVVLVEQSVNIALQLADRAIFMEKGEVRFSGPTSDLLDRPDILRAVFLQGAAATIGANGSGAGGVRSTVEGTAAPARTRRPRRGGPDPTPEQERAVLLETRGLRKAFGGVVAVRDVDVAVHDGEILGFLGANGAGKTTLFDLVSGFIPADGGTVVFGDLDISDWPAHRRAAAGLGRSFQDARLWPDLTVAEALALSLHREAEITGVFPALLGPPRVAESEAHLSAQVEQIIAMMGLGAFRNKFVSELSTGSRRMVELSTILARRPKLILMDEPSSGIAQRETEALGPLIQKLRAELGCAIMLIEHDVSLIRSVADRIVALDLGAVIATGPPEEVLHDPLVVQAYLGSAPEGQMPAPTKTPGTTKAAPKAKPAPRRSPTKVGATARSKNVGGGGDA